MEGYSVQYEHAYNIVLINTTTKEDVMWEELKRTFKINQKRDEADIMEISLTQYEGLDIDNEDVVKIFDIIIMTTEDYNSATVYFYGEQDHCESLRKIIKSNEELLNPEVEIKLYTGVGFMTVK